ncbi:MAG: hypothetical protein WAM88_01470, partial [Nitrososphaeraceae archaeon]
TYLRIRRLILKLFSSSKKTLPPLFNRDKRKNTIQFTGLSPLYPACKVLLRQDKIGLIPSNAVII